MLLIQVFHIFVWIVVISVKDQVINLNMNMNINLNKTNKGINLLFKNYIDNKNVTKILINNISYNISIMSILKSQKRCGS